MAQEHTIIRIFDDVQGIKGQVLFAGIPYTKLREVIGMLEEMKYNAVLELRKTHKKMPQGMEQSVQNLFNIGGENGA